MGKFINTVCERYLSEQFACEHWFPEGYAYKTHPGEYSEYFVQYGFRVPRFYADYFERMSGVASDRYLSVDLYYNYVAPCLNRFEFRKVYADKNLFSILMPDVKQPASVIKRRRGLFYGADERPIEEGEAACRCADAGNVVLKPAIDSSLGMGVELAELKTRDWYLEKFRNCADDLIVQRQIRQHERMSRLNASSVNTVRLFTFRRENGEKMLLADGAFVRFGGRGSVVDNVCAGGGFCCVDDSGRVDDRIFRYKSVEKGSLSGERQIEGLTIPHFGEMKRLALSLFDRLPYFDYVAWDFAVDSEDQVVLVEYNVNSPGMGLIQCAHGPAFSDDVMDEVMSRVSRVVKTRETYDVSRFGKGHEYWVKL